MRNIALLNLVLVAACVGVGDPADPGEDVPVLLDGVARETDSPPGCTPGCDANGCCTACALGSSPLMIDAYHLGYTLTNAANGVNFDIRADGTHPRIGWTQANSGIGFLAMDRNGNGIIDNGSELFGSATPQVLTTTVTQPNGWNALQVMDTNHDGYVDALDEPWPDLRVWFDTNHNGISEGGELVPLSWYVKSIRTVYYTNVFHHLDANGNNFWFWGTLTAPSWYTTTAPEMWDVYLVEQTPPPPRPPCSGGPPSTKPVNLWPTFGGAGTVWNAYGCGLRIYFKSRDPQSVLDNAICSGEIDPVTYAPTGTHHEPRPGINVGVWTKWQVAGFQHLGLDAASVGTFLSQSRPGRWRAGAATLTDAWWVRRDLYCVRTDRLGGISPGGQPPYTEGMGCWYAGANSGPAAALQALYDGFQAIPTPWNGP